MISILCFFVCGRGEWSRAAAAGWRTLFTPFMTRGLVDSSHSRLASPGQGLFTALSRRHSPFTKERRGVGCGMLTGSMATAPSTLWEYFQASTYFTYLCTFLCAPVKGGQLRQWLGGGGIQVTRPAFRLGFPPFASSPDSRRPVSKSRNSSGISFHCQADSSLLKQVESF